LWIIPQYVYDNIGRFACKSSVGKHLRHCGLFHSVADYFAIVIGRESAFHPTFSVEIPYPFRTPIRAFWPENQEKRKHFIVNRVTLVYPIS